MIKVPLAWLYILLGVMTLGISNVVIAQEEKKEDTKKTAVSKKKRRGRKKKADKEADSEEVTKEEEPAEKETDTLGRNITPKRMVTAKPKGVQAIFIAISPPIGS